ncbi:MAG: SDR family NAD(P)-dependent oxidoreductase [Planctomycetota bacterium]|nr:MAG: SDR family NAD(P)-dependent oxidoreductase [Planctomycetota bacterium]
MAAKVLVTGAAGFIGSHLVEQLVHEGYDVRAFVHYNSNNNWYNLEKLPRDVLDSVEVVAGDVADAFAIDKAVAGCNVVFHLAALIGIPYSYVAPAAYVSTNVLGTLHILEACRRHNVGRMIHTSTSEAYGTAQYVPIDEKHPLVGQSPYSASKIGADKLVESFWLSFELPACIIRPFNTYGPRQSMRAIIPTIIVQALSGGELKLGNLDPVRDLTFAVDTAKGFIAASKSDKVLGEVVNLGVGKGASIGELVERIGKLLGRDLKVKQDPNRVRPSDSEVMRLISDNSKAKSLMNWAPTVNLDSGLKVTIEYIEDHLAEYKQDIYAV